MLEGLVILYCMDHARRYNTFFHQQPPKENRRKSPSVWSRDQPGQLLQLEVVIYRSVALHAHTYYGAWKYNGDAIKTVRFVDAAKV